MGTNIKSSRCSGLLVERWVTINTGQPFNSKKFSEAASFAPSLYNTHRHLYSIPEIDITDLAPVSHDIIIDRPASITHTKLDMAEENRLNTVETDVGALKDDVGGLKNEMSAVNTKLDKLLESIENMRVSGSQHTDDDSYSPEPRHSCPQAPAHRPQTHHLVDRQLSADDFIEREMMRDRFEFSSTGRYAYSNDIRASRIMAKPYMYLYREGVSSMKHRMELRESMSLNEYIDAALALLEDRRAYDPADYLGLNV